MKKTFLLQQNGFAAIIAIMVMAFLAIVISGLIPMVTGQLKAATVDKDILQAQYAAEAGAKRAVETLDQKVSETTSWSSWLGRDINLLNDSAAVKYNVTLEPNPASATLNTSGTYKITSVGKCGNSEKTITLYYQFSSNGSIIIWNPPDDPKYIETGKYTALSNGDIVAYSDNTVTNPAYGTPYAFATTASSISFQWGLPAKTKVTGVYLDLLPESFFSTTNPRLDGFTRKTMDSTMNPNIIYGSSWSNLWGNITFPSGKSMYIVNGDVTINTSSSLETGDDDQVVIYATGNITINQSLKGNFAFISEKKIQLNSSTSVTNNGQIQMYAKDDLTLNGSVEGYGVFMTRGGLIVHGKRYVKAFMFGRNYVRLDGGATIQGAAYSYGANPSANGGYSIFISGGTKLIYDASAIPQHTD